MQVTETLATAFGVSAFALHLSGYAVYGHRVLSSSIRPNVASWSMWLFGGIVELLTYDSIEGGHWTSSALPLACTIGISVVCMAVCVASVRDRLRGRSPSHHPPEKSDYLLLGFDISAGFLWSAGFGAALANFIAVSTSIVTFIPIWRTTFKQPNSEQPLPWLLWCLAYSCMIGAVALGEGTGSLMLYFYPAYYLLLHGVVLFIACRNRFQLDQSSSGQSVGI